MARPGLSFNAEAGTTYAVRARMGRVAAETYALIRSVSPPLDTDRPLGAEVERVAAVVAGGAFTRCS